MHPNTFVAAGHQTPTLGYPITSPATCLYMSFPLVQILCGLSFGRKPSAVLRVCGSLSTRLNFPLAVLVFLSLCGGVKSFYCIVVEVCPGVLKHALKCSHSIFVIAYFYTLLQAAFCIAKRRWARTK